MILIYVILINSCIVIFVCFLVRGKTVEEKKTKSLRYEKMQFCRRYHLSKIQHQSNWIQFIYMLSPSWPRSWPGEGSYLYQYWQIDSHNIFLVSLCRLEDLSNSLKSHLISVEDKYNYPLSTYTRDSFVSFVSSLNSLHNLVLLHAQYDYQKVRTEDSPVRDQSSNWWQSLPILALSLEMSSNFSV